MKSKFFPVRCTLLAVVSIISLTFSTATQGAPEDLSSEEMAQIAHLGADYQRGVALNKAFALFGITTLRHYRAEVISIKPAALGSGTDIELRANKLLYHQSGKPYFYTVDSDIKPRILSWHWPDTRPFPFCVGFWVNAYADSKDRVQRISVTPFDYSSIAALRRMPSGLWEICMGTGAKGKKVYFLLQPDYLDLDCIFEIEWNAKYGLAFGHFGGAYGGEGIVETEGQGKNWPGWPLANVSGHHVRPGRDGWERYETVLRQARALPDGFKQLIPATQYIASSGSWDVERPVLTLLESKDMPEPSVRCEPTAPTPRAGVSQSSPATSKKLFAGTWEGTCCIDFKETKQSDGPEPLKVIINSSNAVSTVKWNSNTGKPLPATPFCSWYVQEGPRTLVWHGPTWVNTFSMSKDGDTATFTSVHNSENTGSTRGVLRRK